MTAPAKYLSSEIQMRLKRFRFSLAVTAVLLTIVGATGFGDEHNEFYTNFIFYSTLLLFFIYYLLMAERPGTKSIRLFHYETRRYSLRTDICILPLICRYIPWSICLPQKPANRENILYIPETIS